VSRESRPPGRRPGEAVGSPARARRRPPRAAAPEPAAPDPGEGPAGLPQQALRLGVELLGAVGRRAGEVVPPEAQVHLLRAQRELLLAAWAVLRAGRRGAGADAAARPRPRRIPLD